MMTMSEGGLLMDPSPDMQASPYPDKLDAFVAHQHQVLAGSQWKAYFKNLPFHLQWRFHERLQVLQQQSPKAGWRLHMRACAVKSRLLYNITGNSRWGKAMLSKRQFNTRLRQGKPLSPWQRKFFQQRVGVNENDGAASSRG